MFENECALVLNREAHALANIEEANEVLDAMDAKIKELSRIGAKRAIARVQRMTRIKLLYAIAKQHGVRLVARTPCGYIHDVEKNWGAHAYDNEEEKGLSADKELSLKSRGKFKMIHFTRYRGFVPMTIIQRLPDLFARKSDVLVEMKAKDPMIIVNTGARQGRYKFYFQVAAWG